MYLRPTSRSECLVLIHQTDYIAVSQRDTILEFHEQAQELVFVIDLQRRQEEAQKEEAKEEEEAFPFFQQLQLKQP